MSSDTRRLRVPKTANQVSLKCTRCKMDGHNKRSYKSEVPVSNPAPVSKRKKVVPASNVDIGPFKSAPKRKKLTVSIYSVSYFVLVLQMLYLYIHVDNVYR